MGIDLFNARMGVWAGQQGAIQHSFRLHVIRKNRFARNQFWTINLDAGLSY